MSYPVWIYDNDTYRGKNIPLDYGSYHNVSTLGFPNDTLTSLIVAPFTKVTLYEDDYFKGDSVDVIGPTSVATLKSYTGNMNDKTTSIRVARLEPSLDTKVRCCNGTLSELQCGEFKNGSNQCEAVKAEYCVGDRMGTEICTSWCKKNPDKCDTPMLAFCKKFPNNPICTCINSPVKTTKFSVNPACIDKECIRSGYKTSNMLSTNCPDVINCEVQTDMINSGVNMSRVLINQNCSKITPETPAVTPTPTPSPAPTDPAATAESVPHKVPIESTLLFFIILFLVLAILVTYFTKKYLDGNSRSNLSKFL